MAINSGFAYYSLLSILITEYRGAELGTIALLVNIIREMITLLDVGIGKRKRHDPSLSRSHARKYILRFWNLEVHSEVQRQTSVVRRVELIVTDIRQTHVIGQVGIKHVVGNAAAQTKSAVEALEAVARERRIYFSLAIVLYLSAHTTCQVSAGKRLDGEVVVDRVGIFHSQRHLQIVQVVGHLLAVVELLLAALLGIV